MIRKIKRAESKVNELRNSYRRVSSATRRIYTGGAGRRSMYDERESKGC